MQAFLKSSLPRILKRFPVILFIDALDECGEQSAVELIEYLKHLLKSLPSTDSRFGVCFSCRHYPILELEGGSAILLDTENHADITTYIQARFSAHPDAYVARLISDRAQGVFMWAHIVLERVLRLMRQGESRGEIETEIKRTPQTLDDLYRGLIKVVENRSDTVKLMQWICFSTKRLTTDELQWAMAVNPDCTYKSLDECRNSDEFIANDKIDRRINALSCGLAEIVPSNNARIVQFIHQSVKDFFVNGGLMTLDNTTKAADLVVPAAHCRLSRTCLHYFKIAVHSHAQPFRQADKPRFPLVHYATTSWVSHVKSGEPAETSQSGLLDLLGWPRDSLIELWVRTYKKMEPYGADRPPSGIRLIHVISRYGLAELLLCLLQECGESGAHLNVQDSSRRSPLSWAAEKGHEALVKLLLDTGKVDVNARDKKDRTPLLWAAAKGHDNVVGLLVDTGRVDVNARDKMDRTPLLWAAGKGHDVVVKLLLDTGKVDVNARDKEFGQTPLSLAAEKGRKYGGIPPPWAAWNGHEAVVKLLLDTGKVDVDSRDKNGRSPLSWAAEKGHEAAVRLLVDTGKVDMAAEDVCGLTASQFADFNHHTRIDDLLLAQGAPTKPDFYGLQALFAEPSSTI